jgi:hypothetical protein
MAVMGLAGAALAAAAMPSAAEPLPPLRDDFVVEGTVFGDRDGMPMTLRHHAGMVRTDIAGAGQPVVSLLELATRKVTGIVTAGGRTMVMEMQLDGLPGGNHLCVAEGTRIGSSTVLGEGCDEYETEEQDVARRSRVCVTRDGIPLRTVEVASGKTVWLAARVSRAPQDAALFQVPADAVRLPAGAGPKPLNTR